MAIAYAINTQKVDILSSTREDVSEPQFVGTFSIRSKLENIGIKEGAKAIISKPENKDLKFISVGEILKVIDTTIIKPSNEETAKAIANGSPPPRDTYRHNFQIEINQKLSTNNLLSELEYSLKEVYRFNNPIVHFQTQYTQVKEDDYKTIVEGLIYTARTAFGKLVNAIPRLNKFEFVILAMNEYSTIDFAKISLQEGLDFLHDYLERRILKKGVLLVETDRILKRNFSDVLIPGEVGFIDPVSEKYNLISVQANYFEQLIKLERENNFKDYVKQKIAENAELESRFNKLFEKETWPIDLRL